MTEQALPPPAVPVDAMHRTLDAVGGGAALKPLFSDSAETLVLAPGTVLARQGDREPALYLLMEGSLDVLRETPGQPPQHVATLRAPNVVGEMQLLTGGVRLATLRAASPSTLARVPGGVFERAAAREPALLDAIAALAFGRLRRAQLLQMLPTLLGTADPALVGEVAEQADWSFVRRGEAVVREGEPGGDVFLLVDGRLRALLMAAEGRVLGELVPGDVVGETQLFTGGRRGATVLAMRDSVLARFTREKLEAVMRRLPELGMRLARVAVERAQSAARPLRERRTAVNVLMVGADAALLAECAGRLAAALRPHGSVFEVSRATVGAALGNAGLCDLPERDPRATQLNAWLSEQETQHGFLLFVADASAAWTTRCRNGADLVLHVAHPSETPQRQAMGESDPGSQVSLEARHWLVVLHDGEPQARGTAAWGRTLPIGRYFHLCRGDAAADGRLARAVAGREVGVVLGGGGARGYAHLGLLRALQELGIPIDVIGGTSAGAAISGYHAAGRRGVALEACMRDVLGGPVDYTVPVVAISAGRRMLQRNRQVFGALEFEDLPLPMFCIATDITKFGMLVIDRGPVAEGVMASTCLPGIFPPVNIGGSWAVDGALVNAVPMDVMRELIGPNGVLIASDVNAGEMSEHVTVAGLAGVGAAQQLYRMALRQPAHPIIADVLQRAATAAGDHQLKRSLAAAYPDLCIRHDTAGYSVIDFKRSATLTETGYATAMEALRPLIESGRLPPFH